MVSEDLLYAGIIAGFTVYTATDIQWSLYKDVFSKPLGTKMADMNIRPRGPATAPMFLFTRLLKYLDPQKQ